MQAIAIVGVLSLAVELADTRSFATAVDLAQHVERRLAYLVTSRPTAVNMAEVCAASHLAMHITIYHMMDAVHGGGDVEWIAWKIDHDRKS